MSVMELGFGPLGHAMIEGASQVQDGCCGAWVSSAQAVGA